MSKRVLTNQNISWADLGIYVGVVEPSLVSFAVWNASRTGYWAWIDISQEPIGNGFGSLLGVTATTSVANWTAAGIAPDGVAELIGALATTSVAAWNGNGGLPLGLADLLGVSATTSVAAFTGTGAAAQGVAALTGVAVTTSVGTFTGAGVVAPTGYVEDSFDTYGEGNTADPEGWIITSGFGNNWELSRIVVGLGNIGVTANGTIQAIPGTQCTYRHKSQEYNVAQFAQLQMKYAHAASQLINLTTVAIHIDNTSEVTARFYRYYDDEEGYYGYEVVVFKGTTPLTNAEFQVQPDHYLRLEYTGTHYRTLTSASPDGPWTQITSTASSPLSGRSVGVGILDPNIGITAAADNFRGGNL